MEARTFKRFQERDFFNQNLGILGASLCFSKGVRRLSLCLLCPPPLLLFHLSFLIFSLPLDAKGASGFPTTMLLSRGGRVIVPALWGEKPKITISLSTFLSSLPIFTFPNPRQGFAVVNSAGSTFFSILTSPPGKKKKKNMEREKMGTKGVVVVIE